MAEEKVELGDTSAFSQGSTLTTTIVPAVATAGEYTEAGSSSLDSKSANAEPIEFDSALPNAPAASAGNPSTAILPVSESMQSLSNLESSAVTSSSSALLEATPVGVIAVVSTYPEAGFSSSIQESTTAERISSMVQFDNPLSSISNSVAIPLSRSVSGDNASSANVASGFPISSLVASIVEQVEFSESAAFSRSKWIVNEDMIKKLALTRERLVKETLRLNQAVSKSEDSVEIDEKDAKGLQLPERGNHAEAESLKNLAFNRGVSLLEEVKLKSQDLFLKLYEARFHFEIAVKNQKDILKKTAGGEMVAKAQQDLTAYEARLRECDEKINRLLMDDLAVAKPVVESVGQSDIFTITTVSGPAAATLATGASVQPSSKTAITDAGSDDVLTLSRTTLDAVPNMTNNASIVAQIKHKSNDFAADKEEKESAQNTLSTSFALGFLGATYSSSGIKVASPTQSASAAISPSGAALLNLGFLRSKQAVLAEEKAKTQISNRDDANKHFNEGLRLLIEKRDYKNAILYFDPVCTYLKNLTVVSDLSFLHRVTCRLGESLFKNAEQINVPDESGKLEKYKELGKAEECFAAAIDIYSNKLSKGIQRVKSCYDRHQDVRKWSDECKKIKANLRAPQLKM